MLNKGSNLQIHFFNTKQKHKNIRSTIQVLAVGHFERFAIHTIYKTLSRWRLPIANISHFFAFKLHLGFVAMPNHVHGIIEINKPMHNRK